MRVGRTHVRYSGIQVPIRGNSTSIRDQILQKSIKYPIWKEKRYINDKKNTTQGGFEPPISRESEIGEPKSGALTILENLLISVSCRALGREGTYRPLGRSCFRKICLFNLIRQIIF